MFTTPTVEAQAQARRPRAHSAPPCPECCAPRASTRASPTAITRSGHEWRGRMRPHQPWCVRADASELPTGSNAAPPPHLEPRLAILLSQRHLDAQLCQHPQFALVVSGLNRCGGGSGGGGACTRHGSVDTDLAPSVQVATRTRGRTQPRRSSAHPEIRRRAPRARRARTTQRAASRAPPRRP